MNFIHKIGSIPYIIGLLALTLSGCDKDSLDVYDNVYLPVEEKNGSLYFHYSMTGNPASGGIGYTTFADDLILYDSLDVLATITFGNVGGANNDTIFTSHIDKFNFVTIPYYQRNLDSITMLQAITAQAAAPVIVNAAYELVFEADKIIVNTTTQFFQDAPDENYYLSAYIIVDSIIANQAGHPDGSGTAHRKVVVDIGRPAGYEPQYFGYQITSGNVDKGYRFNLTFEADRLPSWTDTDQISVALVLTTRDANGRPIFVNANTKH